MKFQGRTASGVLEFDLVTNRDGSKYFIKPRMEAKDSSWKDAIASVVLQVFLRSRKFTNTFIRLFQVFHDRKVPPNVLPLNPELKTRNKPASKPEKSEAVARHQTRMKVA